MLQMEKKKRTHSGQRSKSRKYRGNEYSVDLRGKHMGCPGEGVKVKTENSSSLNKSRPSRKNSTKQQKKHTKSNNKDSKEPASHSVSAERRHSIIKMNRTEANFENEDFQLAIDQLLMGLRSVPQPPCLNARLIGQYFNDMKKFYGRLDGPFNRLCLQLHSFYVSPMQRFLQLVMPMEDAIRRKEQIAKEIDKQIIQNEELFQKLEPIDIEIFKLKQKIEENRILIEQKKQQKQEKQKEKQANCSAQQPQEREKETRTEPMAKGFKLDLENINKTAHMGYHQQFYSKIQEFSESWRNQALKQKRF